MPPKKKADDPAISKTNNDRKNSNKGAEPDPEVPQEPPINHVYLYLQLQRVENLPKYCDDLEREFIIELSHISGNVQRLKEPFEPFNTRLNLNEKCRCALGDFKLTFTCRIEQDSFDEMNVYSDCPLIVTIYQLTPRHPKEDDGLYMYEMEFEPEWEDAHLEAIAMGYIDLFQFFSTRRALANLTHLVYPLKDRRLKAFKMSWHIYSLLPLLKKQTFENILFLQLDSIYNTHKDLLNDCEDLVMDVSLRKLSDPEESEEEGEQPTTYKICSFTGFSKEVIVSQDENYVWSSMKDYEPVTGSRLCQHSGLSMNKYQIFANALCTENVEFDLDLINTSRESALVCNGAHRYVLNQELAKLLETAMACPTHELLLEVYRFSLPEVKLLVGTASIAILAFPGVFKMQFIIELQSEEKQEEEEKGIKDKKKGKNDTKDARKKGGKEDDAGKVKGKHKTVSSKSTSVEDTSTELSAEEEEEPRTVFATLKVCLLYPIGEGNQKLYKYNETETCKDTLKTCRENAEYLIIDPRYCEECYRNFDHVVLGTIIDIINNNIYEIEQCPSFFCCHLANMTNRLTKIVACDFNRRCKTSTSIEFSNLMTIVFKELELRMYRTLGKCSENGVQNCTLTKEGDLLMHINIFNLYKMSTEAGNYQFANIMYEKAREDPDFKYIINFYKFLYDVEIKDFNAAEEYFDLPLSEKDIASNYYTDIIELYIGFKKVNMSEGAETDSEEPEIDLGMLLEALLKFTNQYPKDIDVWIVLYCYYYKCQYVPGMEYTRWKFENLYNEPQRVLAFLPVTLWDMHYKFDEEKLFDVRCEHFFKTLKTLLNIGVYDLAKVVHEYLAKEFTDFENYCIENTFQVLQQMDMSGFKQKSFTHKDPGKDVLKATEEYANGHVKYYTEDLDGAMQLYGNIASTSLDDYKPFELGLLRYGYECFRRGQYNEAFHAFDKINESPTNRLLACYGKGKAMYFANNFEQAISWFAECTKFDIYIPDVWAWLALNHLKLNENFKSLECWKQARLDHECVIDDTILDELDKIDIHGICLYVDLPKPYLKEKCLEVLKSGAIQDHFQLPHFQSFPSL